MQKHPVERREVTFGPYRIVEDSEYRRTAARHRGIERSGIQKTPSDFSQTGMRCKDMRFEIVFYPALPHTDRQPDQFRQRHSRLRRPHTGISFAGGDLLGGFHHDKHMSRQRQTDRSHHLSASRTKLRRIAHEEGRIAAQCRCTTDQCRLIKMQSEKRLLKEQVDEEDIAEIVSRWTHIPVSKLVQGEREKLLALPEKLHERVVGQDEAVDAVADSVLRARAGLKDPKRPIASFIFLGPTGVGKTELAKALAEDLFDDERAMIRIDMSEYMEKHSVSRLVGAPPGYVGYDEGGQLTEAVRRRPYSVILFDEIEKAHHDVFNIFLQILDDGALTDSRGRRVDFKNTIIIMTSNLGSDILLDAAAKGELDSAKVREQVMELMKQNFRPEFLNRIDETLMFHALTLKDIERILDIQMKNLGARMEGLGIKVELGKAAKTLLAKEGYDPLYGARPLKRVIVREIETPVSKLIVGGELAEGSTLKIDAVKGSLKFDVVKG